MAGLLAVAGCSDGDPDGSADPTVPTAASTSTTAAAVDVATIPAVSRDYSATATAPGDPAIEYLSLRPVSSDDDPKSHNPTAWQIDESGCQGAKFGASDKTGTWV